MASPFEVAFVQHLVVPDSLSDIVRMELPPDLLPTDALRPLFLFASDYWHAESTEGTAPSPAAMRLHFAAVLAEHEIDLDIEPEDVLSWAVEALRGTYIDRKWQPWMRKFAGAMAEADILAKQALLEEAVGDLMSIQTGVSGAGERLDARIGIGQALEGYHQRVAMRLAGTIEGLTFGFPPIDQVTNGIRPSELCILGAPPKSGKSFFLLNAARVVHDAGGIPVVFSLENSVEMTMDRLACMVMGVDAGRWQRGEATADEIERVRAYSLRLASNNTPFHVLQPPVGQRTVEHMIRMAKTLGDFAIIDQLTFVEPSPKYERLPRYQQIGNSLHELKSLISSGSRMPCLLAHQVNREGQKAAEKAGRLEMYHLAESSEVERTADWVFGLWANRLMKQSGRCYVQTLAARRSELLNWEMIWRPWQGQMQVQREVILESDED